MFLVRYAEKRHVKSQREGGRAEKSSLVRNQTMATRSCLDLWPPELRNRFLLFMPPVCGLLSWQSHETKAVSIQGQFTIYIARREQQKSRVVTNPRIPLCNSTHSEPRESNWMARGCYQFSYWL